MIDRQKYGPWAVIAGGSEGVGASFAQQIAATGINLVLMARKPGPLEQLAQDIRADYGVQVRTMQVDLRSPEILDQVRAVTDDLDVGLLVYNAGDAAGVKPFLDRTLDEALATVLLSPIGQVKFCHHFGRKFAERGRGGIMLVGSLAGNAGSPLVATYSAAKAFTQMLAESLWNELKPRGIDVLITVIGAVVSPSLYRSGMGDTGPVQVCSSDDVARDALANLGEGPVHVFAPWQGLFHEYNALPRREAAEKMNAVFVSMTQ